MAPQVKINPGINISADVKPIVGGAAIPIEFFSAVDGTTIIGDGTYRRPLKAIGTGAGVLRAQLPLLNGSGGTVALGAPVYGISAGQFSKALANALATSSVIGLVADATVLNGASGVVVTSGPVTGTTAQWDAITGQVGGLTPNTHYYLDPTTAGKLTITAPSAAGKVVAPVGLAISALTMIVNVQATELLS